MQLLVLSSAIYQCRFTPEEKAKHHPCAYMPFGYGPRNCIGMRFALLEVKIALIEMVSKFTIVLAPETKVRQTLNTIAEIVQTMENEFLAIGSVVYC